MLLLSGFQSQQTMEQAGPWIAASPFDHTIRSEAAIVLLDHDGGTCSFRESQSTRAECSTEHLSGSLGVTVSVPFASANVTGTYDRLTIENSSVGSMRYSAHRH